MSAYGSAISRYYVHYRAQSYIYRDREVNAKNSGALVEYAQIKLQQSTNKLKSSISKTKKKKYLNAINALMGRKNNLSTIDQQKADKAYQELEQIIVRRGEQYLIDRLSGAVTKITQDSSQPSVKMNEQSLAISQEKVEDFINKFNKIVEHISTGVADGTLEWKDGAFDGDLEKLLSLTQELNKRASEIKYIASKNLKNEAPQFFRNLTKAEKLKNLNWLMLDNEWTNYIATFNRLASEYNLLFDSATLLQGTHFENILGAAAELAFNTGVESLVNNLKDIVVGGEKQSATFIIDGLNAEVWLNTKLGQSSKQIITTKNGMKMAIIPKYSQGKVDVQLTYKKNILTRSGQPITISAKSISGLSEIGLVKQTTADAIIDQEEDEYKKMFLNIMAERSEKIDTIFGIKPGSDQYYSLAKAENVALNILKNQKQDAVLSFKILSAYKALTGDILGRAFAKLFVINDIKTQKVYLIEMSDIVTAIVRELTNGAHTSINRLFSFESTPNLETVRYINTWVNGENGEMTRMVNLLNSVHAHKIQVALKGNQVPLKNMGMSINSQGKIGIS